MNSIRINYCNIKKTLPDKIDFCITLNTSVLSNVLLKLEIGTIKKNPYIVFTNLSNSYGDVSVTKNELVKQIDSETNFAIMDYCGINNNFNGIIKASIPNEQEIQNALNAYKLFSEYIEYPKNYKNNILILQKTIEFIDIKKINIKYEIADKLN
jgi:hypothetical protein